MLLRVLNEEVVDFRHFVEDLLKFLSLAVTKCTKEQDWVTG